MQNWVKPRNNVRAYVKLRTELMNGKYDLESKRQVATSKDLEVKESNWDDTWKTFLD